MNKNKKIILFLLSVFVVFIIILMYSPSHAQYYEDYSGSLALYGQASLSPSLFANKIIELSTNEDSGVVYENSISYSSKTYNAGYRYEGANVNNYVWFNCSDTDSSGNEYGKSGYSYSTSCELWRIVAVRKGIDMGMVGINAKNHYVKLIRDTEFSTQYAFDTSIEAGEVCHETFNISCTESNHYSYSTLSNYLNGDYYNSLSTNSKKMIKSINFPGATGVNINANVSSYIGGRKYTALDKKIGMIDISDYLISASHTTEKPCHTLTITDFASDTYSCHEVNWLYKGLQEWLMLSGDGGRFGEYIKPDTRMISTQVVTTLSYVRPSVYLDYATIYLGGTGTINSPYIINSSTIYEYHPKLTATEYYYNGSYQKFTAPQDGYYYIEATGASGGGSGSQAGYGAKTSGYLYLTAGEVLYIYVGNNGNYNNTTTNTGGFNGGGYSGNNSAAKSYGGGGATDIRCFVDSNGKCATKTGSLAWNDAVGLNSRIMVAGGGGGGCSNLTSTRGGYGGSISGGSGGTTVSSFVQYAPSGATQLGPGYGYNANRSGGFGSAVQSNLTGYGGGGGGGYYSGAVGYGNTGSGGSSFISGFQGCIAIASSSDTAEPRTPRTDSNGEVCTELTGLTDETCSYHYSGKIFENPLITADSAYQASSARIVYSGLNTYNDNMYDIFVAPKDGYYYVEGFGAKGGGSLGGLGAYAGGYLYLTKNEKLYIYVGTSGGSKEKQTNFGGFNGGAPSGSNPGSISYGGGGATDVRYFLNTPTVTQLEWNYYQGLSSRILVAGGGGGGAGNLTTKGGNGGTYTGSIATSSDATYNTALYLPTGGTQISEGYSYENTRGGFFGYAHQDVTLGYGGGGGSGYYGGGNGYGTTGAGGSSYVSGYLGCVSVLSIDNNSPKQITDSNSNVIDCATNPFKYSSCSEHFTGMVFENANMLSGVNNKDGYVNIIYIGKEYEIDSNTGEYYQEFSYSSNNSKTVEVPYSGYYLLEVWGASGTTANGKLGGYGGYSKGVAYLNSGEAFTVVVGGQGGVVTANGQTADGGYNGGGGVKIAGHSGTHYSGAGGGATHIALASGLLKDLSAYKGSLDSTGSYYVSDKVLIVAAGGGGGAYHIDTNYGTGGHAGGYKGNNGYSNGGDGFGIGATQTAAGSTNSSSLGKGGFGYGGATGSSGSVYYGGGGGGGFFGGGGASPARYSGGGGGASYIASSRLLSYGNYTKAMYCYGCVAEPDNPELYTIVTSCVESTATADCAMNGHGYAKVTFLG